MHNIITQIIGIISTIFVSFTYVRKTRKSIIIFTLCGNLFSLIHYILLGSSTAIMIGILANLRCVIYLLGMKYKWASNKLWVPFFVLMFCLTPIIAWENVFSILPALAGSILTISLSLKNTKYIRILALIPPLFYIPYFITLGSIGSSMNHILSLLSAIIGILKYEIKPKKVE